MTSRMSPGQREAGPFCPLGSHPYDSDEICWNLVVSGSLVRDDLLDRASVGRGPWQLGEFLSLRKTRGNS